MQFMLEFWFYSIVNFLCDTDFVGRT